MHGVQKSDSIREPSLHLQDTFPHRITRRWLSDIFREKDSEVAEGFDCGQENRDDLWFTLVTRFTGLDASGSGRHGHLVFQDRRACLTVHQDVNNI